MPSVSLARHRSIGTESLFANKETKPDGTPKEFSYRRLVSQGGDTRDGVTPDDFHTLRIFAQLPTAARYYGPKGQRFSLAASRGWRQPAFGEHAERMHILGDIPLRKLDANGNVVRDSDGNPDTSFRAIIPADVSFTFGILDKKGEMVVYAQTWHQVRPGETRNNCGGCHGHQGVGLPFEGTAASKPDYRTPDLAATTPIIMPGGRVEVREGATYQPTWGEVKPKLSRVGVNYERALELLRGDGAKSNRGKFTVDDTIMSIALASLPMEDRYAVKRWASVGSPNGSPVWEADEQRPSVHMYSDDDGKTLFVGAMDVGSGLASVVLRDTATGKPMPLERISPRVQRLTGYDGRPVELTAFDLAGNTIEVEARDRWRLDCAASCAAGTARARAGAASTADNPRAETALGVQPRARARLGGMRLNEDIRPPAVVCAAMCRARTLCVLYG